MRVLPTGDAPKRRHREAHVCARMLQADEGRRAEGRDREEEEYRDAARIFQHFVCILSAFLQHFLIIVQHFQHLFSICSAFSQHFLSIFSACSAFLQDSPEVSKNPCFYIVFKNPQKRLVCFCLHHCSKTIKNTGGFNNVQQPPTTLDVFTHV